MDHFRLDLFANLPTFVSLTVFWSGLLFLPKTTPHGLRLHRANGIPSSVAPHLASGTEASTPFSRRS